MAGDATTKSEEFVNESLTTWTPRFVANGIDYNDLARLRERIDGWEEWCDEFAAMGDHHAELGEDAEDRGDLESAGDHFTQAAMYFHFGSHVWHEDEERRDRAHQRAVTLYERGGEYLDPPVQRIEAPSGDGFDVPGHLRVPDETVDGESGESPLVVLLPGLDSIKEEIGSYTDRFLERGMATLAVDGAAQGETWYNQGMTPEYPRFISAVLDHVQDIDPEGVDTDRIGLFGVSLGGFYAPYTAAHEDRFDACVGVSGPFTVGPVSTRGSALVREQFQWACKTDSLVEVDEITEAMSLRDVVDDLTAPTLSITGAQDTVISPIQSERIAERSPNGEFVIYEEGNHVCNNIPYKYGPYTADWLRNHLA